jgi:ubiquitin carboxyl-terminal hydrolase 22/27/51
VLILLFLDKRSRQDDVAADSIKEDSSFLALNTHHAPCRASGIRGIYNMGATCYMNVILQCVVHNPLLRNYYLAEGHTATECKRQDCMSCAIETIFQEFYSKDDTHSYSASSVLSSFYHSKRKAYHELSSTKEQDAHEFFHFLMEELHDINCDAAPPIFEEETTPSKRRKTDNDRDCNCIVHQTFYGRSQSTIKCPTCLDENPSTQSFVDISLGLDVLAKKKNLQANVLTLEGCLDEEYVKSEACEYKCPSCENTECNRQLSIKKLPNVLCIQMKVGLSLSFNLAISLK